jgi:hypothetical protein
MRLSVQINSNDSTAGLALDSSPAGASTFPFQDPLCRNFRPFPAARSQIDTSESAIVGAVVRGISSDREEVACTSSCHPGPLLLQRKKHQFPEQPASGLLRRAFFLWGGPRTKTSPCQTSLSALRSPLGGSWSQVPQRTPSHRPCRPTGEYLLSQQFSDFYTFLFFAFLASSASRFAAQRSFCKLLSTFAEASFLLAMWKWCKVALRLPAGDEARLEALSIVHQNSSLAIFGAPPHLPPVHKHAALFMLLLHRGGDRGRIHSRFGTLGAARSRAR